MSLKEHLKAYSRDERNALAVRCGTSLGHLTNVANGFRRCSPELAVALERETSGSVNRQSLFVGTWQLIWPELAKLPEATNA